MRARRPQQGRKVPAGRRPEPAPAACEPVDRRERVLVLGVALLLLCAAAAPIVSGYLHQRPDERFLGLVPSYYEDYQSYFAWMRQAEQGHLLFRDLFTSEPHRRLILLPVFWLMGVAAHLTGVPQVAVWWLAQAVATVLLVLAMHAFAAAFCGDRATRLLALALAATASGLGWLLPASSLAVTPTLEQPIDLWMVEANQFFPVASSYFTLPLSLALMLLALLRVLRYLEQGGTRDAVVAGVLALAVAMTHQYDVVTLLAVVAAWAALLRSRHWRGLVVLAAIPAPFVLYSAAVVRLDPTLARLTWSMPVPGLAAHLVGWGLPLALATLAALVPAARRGQRRTALLVAWPLVAAALLLAPLEFQRKLIWGAQVPLAVLAAMAARWAWERGARRLEAGGARRVAGWGAAVALVAACGVGSIDVERDLLRRAASGGNEEFVPAGFAPALDWLRAHVRPGDVVMASPWFATLVPGATGATVFCGHWAQTIDIDAKDTFLERALGPAGPVSPSQLRAVLARNRVRFLVVDARSLSAHELPEPLPAANLPGLAHQVLRNRTVAIWETDAVPAASEVAAWGTGDWRGP